MSERAITQADGNPSPLKNDARAYLNEALQLIELQRRRLQMSLGAEGAKALEDSILSAKRELDAERVRRVPPGFPGTIQVAVDRSAAETLREMEKTNRELQLTGDQLAIEEELG